MIRFYLAALLVSILSGYFYQFSLDHSLIQNPEFIKRYLQSVEEIFDLQSIEVSGIAEFNYIEKDEHLFSFLTNPLFSKEYQFYIPFKATYGVSLKKTKTLKFFNSKIYVNLPNSELLSFDLQIKNKKILSQEGFLVFQKDDKFFLFEKYVII